ncbi:MAG: hypothetical protein PHD41_06355 [Methanosarcinaceae archaeon]|nr:hypothetical protein [Methanosarcinaceae archaeon]
MDHKIRERAAKSIFFALAVYCFLLILFPLGWLILLGGVILQPEGARKLLGNRVQAAKTLNKENK